ncbi:MAG: hypothetical protein HQL23_09115 [Candidatus Omnitrophica bacterium]|nr:hypothetical protein [Candidatus Omnitrophota bacterium]
MSIIHDALKQAQNELEKNQSSAESLSSPPSPSSPLPASSPVNTALWLALVLALGVGFLSLQNKSLFKNLSFEKHPKPLPDGPKPSAPVAAAVPAPQPIAKTEPVPLTSPPKKEPAKAKPIVLNGITLIGGQYIALINNEIYKTGEKFDSYFIREITIDQVILENNGQQILLNLRNKRSRE